MVEAHSLATIEERLEHIEALINSVDPELHSPTYAGTAEVAAILADAADMTGVSAAEIVSETRYAPIFRVRVAVAWVARKTTIHSLPRIGRALRRDHTTIISQLQRAEQMRNTDPSFRLLTSRLRARAMERRALRLRREGNLDA